ncbi:MAG: EpsD family peptidyl-prolyl cis-trans isomerase [Methylophilaceae bacterium]
MILPKSFIAPFTLILITLSLVACGKKEGAAGEKSATQVVARVDGEEISVHMLNYQMSRLGQMNEAQAKEASKKVLERLVDQQMLVQQATKDKLDREPKVLQSIESTKREILAQAYMEKQMAAAKKPSEQEIKDFYSQHPELFEKRRIYRLQELAVAVGSDKATEIEAGVKASKNINEVANWLKEKDYKFSANANVRAAEQLPLEMLPRLQQMKEGEFIILPSQNSINIVMLAGVQEQPLTLEKATPLIEQYFFNQRKSEIAKKQIEELRKKAKVEYLGNFSDMKQVVSEKSEPNKQAEEKPKASSDSEHMDKGVTGL